jgi:hypothetical protein
MADGARLEAYRFEVENLRQWVADLQDMNAELVRLNEFDTICIQCTAVIKFERGVRDRACPRCGTYDLRPRVVHEKQALEARVAMLTEALEVARRPLPDTETFASWLWQAVMPGRLPPPRHPVGELLRGVAHTVLGRLGDLADRREGQSR